MTADDNTAGESKESDYVPRTKLLAEDEQALIAKAEKSPDSGMGDVLRMTAWGLGLIVYMLLFSVCFWLIERDEQKWTFIDSWAFAVETIATVGYGVLTPSNDSARVLVIVYIIFGLIYATFTMGVLTEMSMKYMENMAEGQLKDAGGSKFFSSRFIALCATLLVLMTVGTVYGVYAEEWNFIQSVYWTVVTMTTVGYGDFAPKSQGGRLGASFFVLLSTAFFAAIISTTIATYMTARKQAEAVNFIMGALTAEKLKDMDQDGNHSVDRKEFQDYMLVKLGFVEKDVLDLLDDCFTALDADGGGTLDPRDLVSQEGSKLLSQLRDKYGVADDGPDLDAPVGAFGFRLNMGRGNEAADEKPAKEKQQD